MNIKTKVRWGTLAALLMYGGATCGTGAKIGYSCGYHDGQNDAAKERVCQEFLQPEKNELKAKFVEQCKGRNAYNLNDGDLSRIVTERDHFLAEYQCPVDEEWVCRPTLPSNLPKSSFYAEFKRK